ncbi:mechanosensory protein 2 [Caerostris extrusa]|uniref:Mechanosensory protein 2 n=1 Tax=Caerostris extrusa TaxID=172846 RepID=A0AAV4XBM6_CAEEX|nr:mechanosensory protein 2 [Caerostris extrusa]
MTFNVPSQEILIKESVTLQVDAVIYYRVFNAIASVVNKDKNSTHFAGFFLNETTQEWGIKVEKVEIKDVRLPESLQKAMAAEAEATRASNAKVITANGEKKGFKGVKKEAAEIISECPVALQLRHFPVVSSLKTEQQQQQQQGEQEEKKLRKFSIPFGRS